MQIKDIFFEKVFIIELDRYEDQRGFFLETYQEKRYKEIGIKDNFVQDNQSRSCKDVLRGLHFTINKPQSQLMTVLRGKVFDVVVDLRKASPTFGTWKSVVLDDSTCQQIYMPHGFAHGFCVLSDWADLHYKVSKNYEKKDESGIFWNDRTLGIEWPISNPILSKRDLEYPCLNELSTDQLPNV